MPKLRPFTAVLLVVILVTPGIALATEPTDDLRPTAHAGAFVELARVLSRVVEAVRVFARIGPEILPNGGANQGGGDADEGGLSTEPPPSGIGPHFLPDG